MENNIILEGKDIHSREALGNCIKKLRNSKNMSVRECAEMCSLAKSTIVNIEQGRFSPRLEIVQKVLNALDATLTITTL